jgi:hypothetical protein
MIIYFIRKSSNQSATIHMEGESGLTVSFKELCGIRVVVHGGKEELWVVAYFGTDSTEAETLIWQCAPLVTWLQHT